ncbi:hypothetical protein GPDM_11480 [Planococcus donghaensis MPA1U2]|uniref:Prepilin-type N-terminal cleavage/methylation domain-containing protein n=1 Tax=Planococcus donghaensis MPA1U2 TaxID=933115 RepID=E7RII4_9BACL|nr:type II secretion system protein [Planococcus donghaensis]EGA89090.1 hypothetical protein GPDM_11480 [Planococcus donghaensis MPA1U2]
MKNDEKGITMIEILAALVLVSLVVAGAWTAMSIGFKHSVVETTKTHIQQDAALVIAKLSSAHRKSDRYLVKIENKQLMLQTCSDETGCGPYERLIDKDYDFTGTSINGIVYTGASFSEVTIVPKEQHNPVSLTLTSGKASISIDTVLTRLITGMFETGERNESSQKSARIRIISCPINRSSIL